MIVTIQPLLNLNIFRYFMLDKKNTFYINWGICLSTFPIRHIPQLGESVIWGICGVIMIMMMMMMMIMMMIIMMMMMMMMVDPQIPHRTDSPNWGICLMGNVPRHIPQWTEIGDLEHIYTFFCNLYICC